MISFSDITIQDKEWAKELLEYSGNRLQEYSFTFTYLWRKIFQYHIGRLNDYVVIKSLRSNYPPSYLFPAGKGDIEPVLHALAEDAKKVGSDLIFHAMAPEKREILEGVWPGKVEYIELTDYFDYIYESEKLISLSGKKLSGKRNHINRFNESHPDWIYEPITKGNIADVVEMNRDWVSIENIDTSTSFAQEASSVERALRHYFELDLQGGLIRSEGKVLGFSVGDRLTEDTMLVHIEKAYKEIQGAYPKINQQFVENAGKDYKYINREDDSGDLGLRQAKRSYRPVFMGEKLGAKIILP